MPAEKVCEKAGGGEIDDKAGVDDIGLAGGEELDAHDGAGEGGVGGAGEDGDETEAGKEIDGGVEQAGHRVAQGRTDEEEGRDLAAFESAGESHCGEEDFPPPAPECCTAGLETGDDADLVRISRIGFDADAQVIRTDEEGERDDEDAAEDGAKAGGGDDPSEDAVEAVAKLGEDDAGQAEGDGCEGNLAQERPA